MQPAPKKITSDNTILFPGARPPKAAAVNGTVDAISNREDLQLIKDALLANSKKTGLRDFTIFVMGINIGIRGGDLLCRRLGDFYEPDMSHKRTILIRESKTGKPKPFMLRDTAWEALDTYVATLHSHDLGQYLFPSQKRDKTIWPDCFGKTHLPTKSYATILKKVQRQIQHLLSEPLNLGSHSMRKTFGLKLFEELAAEGLEDYAIMDIMIMMNHSSPETTLRYIGKKKQTLQRAYQRPGL